MKKIFTLFVAILFACITQSIAAIPFYSETFDTGMPAGWTETHSGNNAHWGWHPYGYVSPSPNALPAINSSWGFVMLDEDLAIPAAGSVATLTAGGSISCLGHPTVVLKFDQYFKRAQDTCFVDVYNGISWIQYPVSPNNTLNANDVLPANPYTTSIDISATAANLPVINIRFRYKSGPGGGYSWQIDNVQLSENPPTLIADSFNLYVTKNCSGPSLEITKNYYATGMTVHTDFGDGHIDTSSILGGQQNAYAFITHTYVSPSNYNIKQVLYYGTSAVDSLSFLYAHLFCATMAVQLYNDVNGNCTYDSAVDGNIFLPVYIEVDSNNLAIDSISCTGGFTYTAFGNAGDLYKFKTINLPGDVVASCPVSGIISNILQPGVNATKYLGLSCQNNGSMDIGLHITNSGAGSHAFQTLISLQNQFCTAQNAVVTMNFNPDYVYNSATPMPVSYSSGVIVWNINNLTALAPHTGIFVHLEGGSQQTGNVLQTTYSITPVANDLNPTDNTIIIYDTVSGSYDPNSIQVKPGGCVPAGTNLEYTINFENVGNAPAENIYVLDTLPAGLDPGSMRLQFASHNMQVEKIYNGAEVIFRFNFPNIMLPDSSHHESCTGALIYTINTKSTLPFASIIDHRASIYFDYNDPVMTNTAQTSICWPANLNALRKEDEISLYPNPASEELFIKTGLAYESYTISNSMGQVVTTHTIENKETKINIKGLSRGVYYISLKGVNGSSMRKFVKM